MSSTEKYSRRFSSTHIVLVIYTSFHTVCMITWGTGIDRAKPAGWKPQPDQDYLKTPQLLLDGTRTKNRLEPILSDRSPDEKISKISQKMVIVKLGGMM